MKQDRIADAVDLLVRGELVAIPTETVYGLAADAANVSAVAKIFAAKGRPSDHPVIVHLADAVQLDAWARDIPDVARKLAAAFWPGPLTLILKRMPQVSDLITGGQDTVGIRVPAHPLTLKLLTAFGGGIAAPSANRFGRISPTTADHVREELGDRVPLILDGGPCQVGIESTILDLSRGHPVLLRPGAIGSAEIAAVIGIEPLQPLQTDDQTPRVSGALAAHYAPRTPLRVLAYEMLESAVLRLLAEKNKVAVLACRPASVGSHHLHWRIAPIEPKSYAHDLYANLRALDHTGCDLILVETLPNDEAWIAVQDRLNRAAAGSGEDDET